MLSSDSVPPVCPHAAVCADEDGFFHTGDIAKLVGRGTLQIIDRKKNIFKLAQGGYAVLQQHVAEHSEVDAQQQAVLWRPCCGRPISCLSRRLVVHAWPLDLVMLVRVC